MITRTNKKTKLTTIYEKLNVNYSPKKEIENTANSALSELVKTFSEGKLFKRVKSFPQLDVAVTSEELEKMPEEAIHSFKLKFSPIIGYPIYFILRPIIYR